MSTIAVRGRQTILHPPPNREHGIGERNGSQHQRKQIESWVRVSWRGTPVLEREKATESPITVLPESPRKMRAGGQLNPRKQAEQPSSPHAIAADRFEKSTPADTMYPIAMMAAALDATPSLPSRKLNALMNATTAAAVISAFTAGRLVSAIPNPARPRKIPTASCTPSRAYGETPARRPQFQFPRRR